MSKDIFYDTDCLSCFVSIDDVTILKQMFDRKIFSILDELINMSILNHSPVNTSHALRNQKELNLCILKDYNIFKRDENGF